MIRIGLSSLFFTMATMAVSNIFAVEDIESIAKVEKNKVAIEPVSNTYCLESAETDNPFDHKLQIQIINEEEVNSIRLL